jgi:uncharacterized protein (DUF2336 family)
MQISDLQQVNDSCAAIAKITKRSIERHEERLRELKKLLAMVEQVGATDTIDTKDLSETTGHDVLKTALDRLSKEDAKPAAVLRVAG